jgi:RNA polymerase sigma-70 factor, ECF subfamily
MNKDRPPGLVWVGMEDVNAVERCLSGDRDAFRVLVEKYQHRALAHAVRMLRSRDDALDAVQDAFFSAHQGLRGFDAARSFYGWFYAILRNRCLKTLGRRQREPLDAGADVNLLISRGLATDDHLALEHALASLAAADREIVTLRHLDGLSYDELAQYLEIPIGTVMSRLYNARRRLRDLLTAGPDGQRQRR